jgi:PAS domain S-box-containing protein
MINLRETGRTSQAAFMAYAATTGFYLSQDLGWAPTALAQIDAVPFLYPLLAIAAMRRESAHAAEGAEMRFWKDLSLAFSCWLLSDFLTLLRPKGEASAALTTGLLTVFAIAYVLLVLAVDRQPHRRFVDRPLTALERLYTWPTVSLFVLGLWLYFQLIPLYAADQPTAQSCAAYFLIVLNGMLSSRLFFLASATTSPRWRATYGLLALVPFLLAISQFLAEAMRWRTDWAFVHAPRVLYDLAFIVLIVAVESRHQLRDLPEGSAAAQSGEEPAFALTARTLAFALTFPLLHFAGYLPRFFDEPSQPLREIVVLTWLLLLGMMAVFQHRLLERHAEELWRGRKRFEEDFSGSQQDLRLILERQKVQDVQRFAHEKFEIAFHACPYAIAINRLDDASFIEINPAFEKAVGRCRDDVIGHTPEEINLWSNPGDRFRLRRLLKASDTVRRFLLILRTGSGEPVILLFSAQRMDIRDTRAVMSISRELTSQWEQVEALRQPAGLVDRLGSAVYALDDDGKVRHWNRAAADLLGYSATEIRGRSAIESLAPSDTALADVFADIKSRGYWQGEVLHVHQDGHPIKVSGWGTRVGGPSSKVHFTLMILGPA